MTDRPTDTDPRKRGEMPFLDHLEELRWRILWSVVAIAVGTIIGFGIVYYFDVLELLITPVRETRNDPDFELIYLSPAVPFFMTLKLGFLVGFILAFPIVVYQVWSFLSPALETEEKRAIVPALYLGLVLFCAGVALAYFFALPVTLDFFRLFEGEAMQESLEVQATLAMVAKMLIAFGAVFELPVVLMVLTALGLVTPAFLRDKRRHAIVGLTVLASFITPGDAISLTVMMLGPLILLYELAIFLSARIYARRNPEPTLKPGLRPPDGTVEAG